MNWASVKARILGGGAGTILLFFFAVLAVLLNGVFLPDQTLFSNDGPLGELMAQCHRLPERFTGCWADLNNVGFNEGAASPNISFGLQWLLGPVWFSKFYALAALLILGFGAWCFFRRLRLTPLACVLGGLAIMLSSTYFSVACWGVAAHDLTAGMFFLALAALVDTSSKRAWTRLVFGGMAVGMGVAEGADVGAIFSVFVAVFVVYQAWTAEGPRVRNLAAGVGRLTVVVACAAFLAAQPIYSLLSTSIEGVAGAQQDAQTKSQRWDWATQWSLPKREMLGLVTPGLFGYRMDTANGGQYWGMAGRDPAWDRYLRNPQGTPPTGFLRYVGGGNYVGVLVVLLAIWAGAQSLLRRDSAFSLAQRKWLWFWLGISMLTLLLALGRYAPFYQLLYALPYFSTIRNPVKFLEIFTVALAVLFAYGVDGLQRKYMAPADKVQVSRWPGLESWWKRAPKFDQYWVYGCGLVWVGSVAAWLIYSQYHDELVQYLQTVRVPGNLDAVASFSFWHVGWFVAGFFLAAGLTVLIISRAFVGKRTGGVLLGLLLLADLGLANQPWIIYWNYVDKYASNPVVDVLKAEPYGGRVVLAPMALHPPLDALREVYKKEWMQQSFPYYNIQSFDVVEMPRVPQDFSAFAKMINTTNKADVFARMTRAWELTSTRYSLAPAEFGDFWNERVPADEQLRKVMDFRLGPKPGVTAVTRVSQITAYSSADGPFALFEFPGTLARARLCTRWQVDTNGPAVLQKLFDPAFDPKSDLFVAGGVPDCPTNTAAGLAAGTVEIASYAPRDVVLKADAVAPSVLVLDDHYDPGWKVLVDGKAERVLCCDFLMRGVYLRPGNHRVEFKFQPPTGMLYVSLSAYGFLMVCACLNWFPVSAPAAPPPPAPAPLPPTPPVATRRAPNARKKAAAARRAKA